MNRRQTADDYIDADSRFTTVEGLDVHYKRAGAGPAVVLLHGSGSSLHHFDEVAAGLASSFDVIRPDLPGFGLTGPRPDRDYHVQTYIHTVAAFMDALGIKTATLVGNSLGGNIAWNFTLDYPDRVHALVLINATGYPGKSLPLGIKLARNPVTRQLLRRMTSRAATERNLRQAFGPGVKVDAATIDRVHAMLSRPGNLDAFIDFANTDQIDRTAEIPRITTPTLVLRGAEMEGQLFARDIPASKESAHPGGGHLLPEEAPAWVETEIRNFLTTDSRFAPHQPQEERP
ncbi:alpha/beta fold hydrolase [Nocardia heshunensis]